MLRTLALCGLLVLGVTSARSVEPRRSTPSPVPATADRVLERVREPGASAVLVNVWATWCTPCREEFPDLMRLRREYQPRGLRVVLVSADFPEQSEKARRFLSAQGVDFPTFLKAGKDMEFIDRLEPRWSGALPATFLFDRHGTLHSFREGRTTHAVLESLLVAVMSEDDSTRKEQVR